MLSMDFEAWLSEQWLFTSTCGVLERKIYGSEHAYAIAAGDSGEAGWLAFGFSEAFRQEVVRRMQNHWLDSSVGNVSGEDDWRVRL